MTPVCWRTDRDKGGIRGAQGPTLLCLLSGCFCSIGYKCEASTRCAGCVTIINDRIDCLVNNYFRLLAAHNRGRSSYTRLQIEEPKKPDRDVEKYF